MIEKMEKLYICSLKEETAELMESLMRCGAVELAEADSMMETEAARSLTFGMQEETGNEEEHRNRLQECLTQLKPYWEKRGLFYKRPEITYEELTCGNLQQEAMEICSSVQSLISEKRELQNRLNRAELLRLSYLPWTGLDLPAEEMETGSCKTLYYAVPGGRSTGELQAEAAERGLPFLPETVSSEGENRYLAVLFLKKDEKEIREMMGAFGAAECPFDGLKGTFAANAGKWETERKAAGDALSEKERQTAELAEHRGTLETAVDALNVKMEYLSGREKVMRTEKADIITGWVPSSGKKRVSRILEQFSCFFAYRLPEKGEEYPVLIKNSRLVEPFGTITEMYSLPDSRSVDTNWAIGFFFFLFFGMMLSDAGYGLVLLIAGLGGAKFLDVGDGTKRMLKMLGLCGISTVFWGALYGSWFGDAIPKAAEAFFGKNIELPRLIDPLNQPMTVLVLSCLFGAVHLFAGMGIKACIMIRQGDRWGALFDVGFWYLLLIGLPMLPAPEPWSGAGKVLSAAGAAGLVLTQGRHKPTIAGKLASGVMSLYGITGYFSDVLSYSRILALGLATGVVASVVNIMGTMAGGGIMGFLLFAGVFAAGHLLNLGINALGAYVHSARLQYVEFFGKYYEGGGKKFDPLRIKTKYVRITEEK